MRSSGRLDDDENEYVEFSSLESFLDWLRKKSNNVVVDLEIYDDYRE